MTHATSQPRYSPPELLVLHTIRLNGLADDAAIADRTGVDREQVSELLADEEAYGWVTHVEFAGSSGWTLTDSGRAEGARRLAEELDLVGARSVIERTHHEFGAPNARLMRACTDWQLRPDQRGRLVANDHQDRTWDTVVLNELSALANDLKRLMLGPARALARFAGYDLRFSAALAQARAGDERWVAGIGIDSCHVVWMQLHEDLIATLGIERGSQTEPE